MRYYLYLTIPKNFNNCLKSQKLKLISRVLRLPLAFVIIEKRNNALIIKTIRSFILNVTNK